MLSTRKPKVVATNIVTPNSNNNNQSSSNNLQDRPTHLSKRSLSANVNSALSSVSPQIIARSTTTTPNSVTSNGSVKNIPQPKARISNPKNVIRSTTNTLISASRLNGTNSHSSPSTVRRGPKSDIAATTANPNLSARSLLFSPPPPNSFPTIQPDDLVSNVSSTSGHSDNSIASETPTEESITSETSQLSNENSEFQEARTNRRILDLEISNKSLLLINTNLEQKLKKQAEQIENLKKELILVNSKKVEILKVEELQVQDKVNGLELDSNTQFNRLFSICDQLVMDGERALMEDVKSSGTKVISVLPPELASDVSMSESDYDMEEIGGEEGNSESVNPAQLTPGSGELTFTSIDTAALQDEVD